jgi:hypothetical protein
MLLPDQGGSGAGLNSSSDWMNSTLSIKFEAASCSFTGTVGTVGTVGNDLAVQQPQHPVYYKTRVWGDLLFSTSFPMADLNAGTFAPSSLLYVMKERFYGFLQDYALTGHPTFCSCDETSCSGHEARHIDLYSSRADLTFCIVLELLLQHLMRHAFAGTPFSASWLVPAADFYSFLLRFALPSNELPVVLAIPAESLAQFLRMYEIPQLPSIEYGNEVRHIVGIYSIALIYANIDIDFGGPRPHNPGKVSGPVFLGNV